MCLVRVVGYRKLGIKIYTVIDIESDSDGDNGDSLEVNANPYLNSIRKAGQIKKRYRFCLLKTILLL